MDGSNRRGVPVHTTDGEHDRISHRILHHLGFFGHYMHFNVGGRSGKQHMLAKLHMAGGHLSQRELLDRSDVSSAALSEVLSKLEAEGLIVRERSEEDRRQMQVSLTEEGLAQAARQKAAFDEFEACCLSCLDDDEQEQLLGLLDRLEQHWKQMEWKGDCA